MEEYQLYTLPNGIRVVHKQVTHTQIAHLGIMLDMGSRDEQPHQQGLAHFWEHLAFKGTKKRNAFHILNRLEAFGGELNAYTTKEKICFYASVLKEHYETALELLVDITFNATFPEKHIQKEKSVILEEMAMYYDSPEDALQDDFDAILFQNHSLGYNILGTQTSVNSFKRSDLQQFIAENLDTSKIIVSSVGNLPFKKIQAWADKYLAEILPQSAVVQRVAPVNYSPITQTTKRPITQAHAAIGRQAYALTDPKRLPFFMLSNLLGGIGMNSRLNLSVREKHGLVYSVDANYSPLIDTGFFGIYFATEKKNLKKATALILKEMKLMKDNTLTTTQLHRTKQQLMGQLAMAEEGNMSFMLMMAKSLLDINRIDSLEDIFVQIKAVQAKDLRGIAEEMFDESQFSFLTLLPE